jgi:multidrug efflux pump
MMCARLLRHRPAARRGRLDRGIEQALDRVIAGYGRALDWVLDRSALTMLVFLATLALTLCLYAVVPKGFFPVQDTGAIQAITEAPQSVSFAAMSQRQQALADILLRDPDVASLTSFVGVDGTNPSLNQGRMQINLKPAGQRGDDVTAVMARLKQAVADLPGIQLYMQPVQDLTIDTSISRATYQLVLENPDPAVLADYTQRLVGRLRQEPSIQHVADNLAQQGSTVDLVIDRAGAARFGITPATVDNVLYDSFGQRIVSTIYTQSNQYRVIIEAAPDLQQSLTALSHLYLPSAASSTGQVPLSAIVRIVQRSGPLAIDHLSQFPSATISFDLAPGASLGEAVTAVNQAKADAALPASFVSVFQGAAAAFQASLSNEVFLLLAAIATMYIVLGVLYESFIHPVTILSTLPSAGIGALLALMISGNDLDIIGIIGIVLLIGIVKKNAIMMVDFALEAERTGGLGPRAAIHQASLLRFRPILMTTMAALLGALPLMLGTGTGSELRRPLGLAIVGGLLVSQVLTLFTTPVIYLVFDRLAGRLSRRRSGGARSGEQAGEKLA